MVADRRLEQFRTYLAEKGRRLTLERAIVASEALAAGPVVDAEQLLARLSERPNTPRISRSTVNRVLTDLQECGLIDR